MVDCQHFPSAIFWGSGIDYTYLMEEPTTFSSDVAGRVMDDTIRRMSEKKT